MNLEILIGTVHGVATAWIIWKFARPVGGWVFDFVISVIAMYFLDKEDRAYHASPEWQERYKRLDEALNEALRNDTRRVRPRVQSIDWRRILEVPPGVTITEEELNRLFRVKSVTMHPDRGGKREDWNNLVNARDVARDFIRGK